MNSPRPSGLIPRIVSRFLDFLLLSMVYGIIYLTITGQFPTDRVSNITFQLVSILYFILVPVLWKGYVLGKKVCKVKISKYNSEDHITLKETFLREAIGFHLLSFLSLGITLIISFFMILLREDKRAIHDLIGGTQIVNDSPQGIFLNK
ncbi:RDD family protein [Salipaludibacillus agaradhaerens]|jgi:uncharacterized RDD family membrane protein YckC|uniref:RDD family protein n=1 Tax=Salipaludibacillus agaradhaerens TaxID=76935 RepID=A0A9Q4G0D9_SALAG|nr:RDD family protein [Salipaludibacillus agaradhaerens]MCR6097788.1 RDD family protein [Salipaludibacillus agaradhaerens]MCR6116583.1 RDD family protein [Salipaludibacillus agaradhaerens]